MPLIVSNQKDEPKPALMQLDVYSCGDFDPTDICKKIMKDFDIHKIEYKYLCYLMKKLIIHSLM